MPVRDSFARWLSGNTPRHARSPRRLEGEAARGNHRSSDRKIVFIDDFHDTGSRDLFTGPIGTAVEVERRGLTFRDEDVYKRQLDVLAYPGSRR